MGEYYPEPDEDYDDRVAAYYNDAPPFWRRPAVLGALATIAIFCGVVWFAYNKGLDKGAHRLPPLIQADPGPAKVLPDQPGGLEVPGQDRLIYSQLSGKPEKEGVEQLLPPPEEPVEVPKPEAATQGAPAVETAAGPGASQEQAKAEQRPDTGEATAEKPAKQEIKTAQASDEEDDDSMQGSEDEPKPVEKAARSPVKPVETHALAGASPAPEASVALNSAAPTPLVPAPRPSPYQYQPASRGPMASAPVSPAPVRSAPGYGTGYAPGISGAGYSASAYSAAPGGGARPWVNPDTGAVVQSSAGAPSYASGGSSYGAGAPAYNPGRMAALEPASPGPAARGAAGSYYIQLGSVRDQAQAQSEWARLARRAPEVLGGRQPIAKRADLGMKGVFYRLQAGPYPDRADAVRACDQMRSHGQGCLVVAQ